MSIFLENYNGRPCSLQVTLFRKLLFVFFPKTGNLTLRSDLKLIWQGMIRFIKYIHVYT